MKKIIFILLSLVVFSSCRTDEREDDALFNKNIKVFRYDRLQYEAAALSSFSALQKMNMDFPQATKLLIEDVLSIGRVDDPSINERFCAYYSDTVLLHLMEDASEKFKDMTSIEKGLTEGFRKLKREVPSLPVPRVYSQISALNQSVVVGDSLLGFSIDKYMGADYPLYKRYYYAYQRRSMSAERILPDCFTFYLLSEYPFRWLTGHRSLFDIIIHRGKVNWVVKRLLGMKSDEDMMGYTKEEQEWCGKNEEELWAWMVRQKHIYSTDPMIIRAYTHADPSVVFRGEKIPPTIGIWMGMKLVDKFMELHPDMSMEQLLECTDFDELKRL